MEIKCMEIKNEYSTQTWNKGTEKRISRINHSRKRRTKSILTKLMLKGIATALIAGAFLIRPMNGNISVNVLYGCVGGLMMFL